MRTHYILLLSSFSFISSAQRNTYWVHDSCHNPKYNGGFEAGLEDAFVVARRALMRLTAPISPYMDEIFALIFRVPKSDLAIYNKARSEYFIHDPESHLTQIGYNH
jgi:hypothetical protein